MGKSVKQKKQRLERVRSDSNRKAQDKSGFGRSYGWRAVVLLSVGVSAAILLVVFYWPYSDKPDGNPNLTNNNSLSLTTAIEGPQPSGIPNAIPQQNSAAGNVPAQSLPPQSLPKAASLRLPTTPVELDVESEQAILLKEVERATKDFSQSPRSWHVAGLVYAELLQSENANRCFKQSLELDPQDVQVRLAYADSLEGLGEVEQAIAMIGQTNYLDDAQLTRKRGELLLNFGETTEGAALIYKALAISPDDARSHLAVAQAALQEDKPEQAAEHARKAMELGYRDRPVYIALATALSRLGQRDEAEKIRSQMPPIQKTTVSDSQYAASFRGFASHSYRQIAQIYLEKDFLIEGERLAMRSLELSPESIPTLTMLGDSFRKRSRTTEAVAVYQRLSQLQPDNPVPFHNLSALLASSGDVVGAELALRRAAETDERGVEACYLAQFLLGLGKLDEAKSIAQATAQKHNQLEAYLVWHEACRLQGDFSSAQRVLESLKSMAPDDSRVRDLTNSIRIPK